jgi:hypothetical protein
MEKLNNCHISNVIAAGRHFGPLWYCRQNNGGCRKDGSPRDAILKRSWMVNKDQSPGEGCFESFQGIFLVILHMFSCMRSAVTENVEGDPAGKKQALSRL